MGGMMDATGGWIFLWTFLVLTLAVAGDSIVAARVLSTRHSAEPPGGISARQGRAGRLTSE
jgi:hypothetical protein